MFSGRVRPMSYFILVIEDDEMNIDMITQRLELRGYRVSTAGDGLEGIDLALEEAPDLILMDVSLPEVDGWEATRRLKAAAATRHIPVVALTAHAMEGDREKASKAGCDAYETKPVDFQRLLSTMEALLSREAN
jgi:two-component system, cell cycle response regulator DivK